MFITTSLKADSKIMHSANKIAHELGLNLIPRNTFSLSQLRRKYGDGEILVIDKDRLKFINSDNTSLFFHPNLARIRITSMLKGAKDRLMKVAGIQKGDKILDCTTGLATDAIVFSFTVGTSGKVTTVESVPVLYILAREGLKTYGSEIREIEDAMRRISVIHSDHLSFMKGLQDKSIDVVYFDPMFRQASKTVALSPLRKIANSSPLKLESIYEAKRIARKTIVLKEHLNSGEFERLGFKLISHKAGSKFDYGLIDLS